MQTARRKVQLAFVLCVLASLTNIVQAGCCAGSGAIFEGLGTAIQNGALSNLGAQPAVRKAGQECQERSYSGDDVRAAANLAKVDRAWPDWRAITSDHAFIAWIHARFDEDDLDFEHVAKSKPDLTIKILTLYAKESIAHRQPMDVVEFERAKAKVDQVVPGWVDIVRSKSFKDWMGLQPPWVQYLEASYRPEDAILLLALYKEDKPESAATATRTSPPLSFDDLPNVQTAQHGANVAK